METHIGIGYDIHRLAEGRKLFLGGVDIPYPRGLLGHSDADVLIHAICDALLGAVCEGDIGKMFPDTDPQYRGLPSANFLKAVLKVVHRKGYRIVNVDTVVIAEEPNLAAFKHRIQENLAKIMDIDKNCVNIKAKTNEGMGETGRKEGIACHAVVLIKKEILS